MNNLTAEIAIDAPVKGPEFEVERRAFSAALAMLGKNVIERRNTVPALSGVYISATPGAVSLTGTDLDMLLTISIPADVARTGTGLLDAFALGDTVKAAGRDSVIVDIDPWKGACVAAGRNRTMLRIMPDDYPLNIAPEAEEHGAPAVFELPADQLAQDLARLVPFMCSDGARYYLHGVALESAPVGADGAALAMIATNGGTMVRIFRPIPDGASDMPASVIVPARAAKLLAKLLKGATGTVLLSVTSRTLAVVGDAFAFRTKLIDGTYPNWRGAWSAAEGGCGLQSLALPELEPRISGSDILALEKAGGPIASVEIGEKGAFYRFAGAPEMLALTMLHSEESAGKWNYEQPGHADARDYLIGLARSHGLPVDSLLYTPERYGGEPASDPYIPTQFAMRRGLILGAMFGRVERHAVKAGETYYRDPTPEEIEARRADNPDASDEFLSGMVRDTAAEFMPAEYVPGAFSIAMPRERAGMAARATYIGEDGTEHALRTNTAGALELSAAAIATLVGDPADQPRREIAPLTMWKGRILAPGWHLPQPRKVRAIKCPDTGRVLRSVGSIAIDAYNADPVGTLAAMRPVWIGEGAPGLMFVGPKIAPTVAIDQAPAPQPQEAPEPIGVVPAPEPAEPAPVPAVEPVAAISEPSAPAPGDVELLARIAALEAAVAVLTGMKAPAPAPANDDEPGERGVPRELCRRALHRYAALRDASRGTELALAAMQTRAEAAEARAEVAEARVMQEAAASASVADYIDALETTHADTEFEAARLAGLVKHMVDQGFQFQRQRSREDELDGERIGAVIGQDQARRRSAGLAEKLHRSEADNAGLRAEVAALRALLDTQAAGAVLVAAE
jgi:DNA polymerase III sliding clamp (beta) subunit (PCNA family)